MLFRSFKCWGTVWLSLSMLTIVPCLADEGDSKGPRPVSAAESKAVEMVQTFLEQGAASWWPELADDSPLRQLGQEVALAEIETRLGPSQGAHWMLVTPGTLEDDSTVLFAVDYPSGIDDLLQLDMVEQAGEWRLKRLKCSVDPRTIRESEALFYLEDEALAPVSTWPSLPTGLPLILVVSLGCLLLSTSSRPTSGRPARSSGRLPTTLLLLGVAVGLWSCNSGPADLADGEASEQQIDQDEVQRLAPLADLRRIMAGTDDSETAFGAELASLKATDLVREAGQAWRVHRLLNLGRLGDAQRLLGELPSPSHLPLVELLRARLAMLSGQNDQVAAAYERAVRRSPDNDLLSLEAAIASIISGDDRGPEVTVTMLSASGSRMAAAYYLASRYAILEDRGEKAETLFRHGWKLEPLSRKTLFSDPLLASVASRPAIFELFEFSSVEEPIPPRQTPGRPLELTEGSSAQLVGDLLTVDIGDQQLTIPGGEDLAPELAVQVSASVADASEVEEILAGLEVLTEELSRPGALTHPTRQRRAQTAALALAEGKRWSELLTLTQEIRDEAKGIPSDLVKLRAQALIEEGRDAEGKNLLIRLAKADLENKRRDPGTYYQLAEMFAATEDYDYALRLYQKGDSLSPHKRGRQRIRQIELDRELSQSYESHETDRFLLRYPAETGPEYPRNLRWVLDAEFERLQKFIPVRLAPGQKIEVHLLPLQDFMDAYGGGLSVVGIYDGRVRVPLADLKSLHPILVGILSHELAHAMIDIESGGKAPKWFHEGLASHIEMEQQVINPIPEMAKVNRDLTFAIIDPVLAGFSEPQLVGLAYSHAAWALHYIEARHGVKAIHRLLKAFKKGQNTEQALRSVLRQDLTTFDTEWRRWCMRDAPSVWPTQVVHYERAFDRILKFDSDQPLTREVLARITEGGAPVNKAAPVKVDPKVRWQKWHAEYTRATTPVKQQLGVAVAIIRGQRKGDMKQACSDLKNRISPLLAGSRLKAPSSEVSKSLHLAYDRFRMMSIACISGESAQVQAELNAATRALGKANESLSRWGLKP